MALSKLAEPCITDLFFYGATDMKREVMNGVYMFSLPRIAEIINMATCYHGFYTNGFVIWLPHTNTS